MARPRKYASDAERQAAYRERQREAPPLPADLLAVWPYLVAQLADHVSLSYFPTQEQQELLTLLRRYLPDP